MSLSPARQMLADHLFSLGAVQYGAFRLKLHETRPDAPLSPDFYNLRTPDNPKPGPLEPADVAEIGRLMWFLATSNGLTFDAICGVPNAGDPFAKAVSEEFDRHGRQIPVLTLGKEVRDGKRCISGPIDGDWRAGSRVLLVDDLVSRADSKMEAVSILRNAELVVKDVLVLIDREQGGREDLARHDCSLAAVYLRRELTDYFRETGRIDEATRQKVYDYIAAEQTA